MLAANDLTHTVPLQTQVCGWTVGSGLLHLFGHVLLGAGPGTDWWSQRCESAPRGESGTGERDIKKQ